MGSFLMACGLTNQVIKEDDEVYVIPIVENKHYSPTKLKLVDKEDEKFNYYPNKRVCYPTDNYALLGFIFSAKAEDYGNYDIDWSKQSNKHMLEFFNEYIINNAIPLSESDKLNKENFVVNTEEDYTKVWSHIEKLVWDYELVIKHKNLRTSNVFSNISFYVVHKKAFDYIVDNIKTENRVYGCSKDSPEEIELERKIAFGTIDQQFDLFVKYLYNLQNVPIPVTQETMLFHFFYENALNTYLFKEGHGTSFYALSRSFFYINFKLIARSNPPEYFEQYREFFKQTFKLLEFAISLFEYNCTPKPVEYAGQDYSNEQGSNYFMLLKTVFVDNYIKSTATDLEENSYDKEDLIEVFNKIRQL